MNYGWGNQEIDLCKSVTYSLEMLAKHTKVN